MPFDLPEAEGEYVGGKSAGSGAEKHFLLGALELLREAGLLGHPKISID